jgi:hypothetical protein
MPSEKDLNEFLLFPFDNAKINAFEEVRGNLFQRD